MSYKIIATSGSTKGQRVKGLFAQKNFNTKAEAETEIRRVARVTGRAPSRLGVKVEEVPKKRATRRTTRPWWQI